ncbi:(4Fe-4S)-binding protein [bacterium]|nr:MAG: (4Fe-4S)-binding protein [bacterium]
MKIAVASGKGGTGKTTVATGLAYIISEKGIPVSYLDCDVEEPDGHIFLKPEIETEKPVGVLVPKVDLNKCKNRRRCGEVCQYGAIVNARKTVLTFPELCHSCGGCSLACPENAITEVIRETGTIREGVSGRIRFIEGRMNIGEVRSIPVIKEVKKRCLTDGITIIDAPPGTSCPVIETVRGTDFVILITEPTPFGLNDLKLAIGMIRQLSLPFGVVINRYQSGFSEAEDFLLSERIPVLSRIPFDRKIAIAYSQGKLIPQAVSEIKESFVEIFSRVKEITG